MSKYFPASSSGVIFRQTSDFIPFRTKGTERRSGAIVFSGGDLNKTCGTRSGFGLKPRERTDQFKREKLGIKLGLFDKLLLLFQTLLYNGVLKFPFCIVRLGSDFSDYSTLCEWPLPSALLSGGTLGRSTPLLCAPLEIKFSKRNDCAAPD